MAKEQPDKRRKQHLERRYPAENLPRTPHTVAKVKRKTRRTGPYPYRKIQSAEEVAEAVASVGQDRVYIPNDEERLLLCGVLYRACYMKNAAISERYNPLVRRLVRLLDWRSKPARRIAACETDLQDMISPEPTWHDRMQMREILHEAGFYHASNTFDEFYTVLSDAYELLRTGVEIRESRQLRAYLTAHGNIIDAVEPLANSSDYEDRARAAHVITLRIKEGILPRRFGDLEFNVCKWDGFREQWMHSFLAPQQAREYVAAYRNKYPKPSPTEQKPTDKKPSKPSQAVA